MERQIDHRKQARTELSVEIAVRLKTASEIKAGLLTDISRGGLAFRYVGDVGDEVFEANKPCTLSLKESSNGEVLIKNLPAKVVCDGHIPKEYRYSLLPMNKCSVQFRELPTHLAARLEMLIPYLKK